MENSTIKFIRIWFFLIITMIIIMIWMGGITRLNSAGLSITEWEPISGIIPPLSVEDWENALAKYQNIPEYKEINFGISLERFKTIYLIEYFHRLLGRITGIIILLPLLYLIFTNRISKDLCKKLFCILGLGLIQAAIGWYMVKSGLVDRVDVSQYRLAMHLVMAILIYSLILWFLLDYYNLYKVDNQFRSYAIINSCLILLQIISGAFVAGTHAGLIYNEFPLMGDKFIPYEILSLTPWYINIFENQSTIQFIHRIFAFIIVANIILFYFRLKLNNNSNIYVRLLLLFISIQIMLGIITLLSQVHIVFASMHQMCAIFAYSISLIIVKSSFKNN